jgi:hypothetical protein
MHKVQICKIRCRLDMASAHVFMVILCYLEPSIVFKARVARYVRIQCHYAYECLAMYWSLCKKFKNKSILAILLQSANEKFAITGPKQIL